MSDIDIKKSDNVKSRSAREPAEKADARLSGARLGPPRFPLARTREMRHRA
jgi:hypothetical protein